MDVVGMIKRSKGGRDYTITRVNADGSYNQTDQPGVFVPGATTTLTIKGSLQPMTAQDIVTLPDGDRTKESYRFYSFPDLLNIDVSRLRQGDLVPVNGENFSVLSVEHWPNYSKSIIVKVNTNAN